MYINLKIPDELNEKRKTLNLTWREIIEAGFKYSEGYKPKPIMKDIAAIEPDLKLAVKALSNVWHTIKGTKPKSLKS
jgi:hypothetical protein